MVMEFEKQTVNRAAVCESATALKELIRGHATNTTIEELDQILDLVEDSRPSKSLHFFRVQHAHCSITLATNGTTERENFRPSYQHH